VEVTTFRGEGAYLDGRHPSVVTLARTLAEDLSRRDFTMNAIAFDPRARTIIDLYQGQQDIARQLVRTVGDPIQRFSEDAYAPCGPCARRPNWGSTWTRRPWPPSPPP